MWIFFSEMLLLMLLSFAYENVSLCFLETTVKQIEDAFKEFTTREDIAIVLISQFVSCFLNSWSF